MLIDIYQTSCLLFLLFYMLIFLSTHVKLLGSGASKIIDPEGPNFFYAFFILKLIYIQW